MSWSYVPLLVSGILSSYWLFNLAYKNRDGMYALLATATLGMVVHASSEILQLMVELFGYTVVLSQFHEWSRVISISFILSALGMLIRNSKPAFARFPRVFTAIPILIVASYPFAMDTLVLKDWLMGIYEGGALLIAILMYSVLTYYTSHFAAVIPGIAVLTIQFLSYWFLPIANQWPEWIWYSWLAMGMFMLVMGYRYLDNLGLKPYKVNGATGQDPHMASPQESMGIHQP
jgi:hypothetical protein